MTDVIGTWPVPKKFAVTSAAPEPGYKSSRQAGISHPASSARSSQPPLLPFSQWSRRWPWMSRGPSAEPLRCRTCRRGSSALGPGCSAAAEWDKVLFHEKINTQMSQCSAKGRDFWLFKMWMFPETFPSSTAAQSTVVTSFTCMATRGNANDEGQTLR